MTTVPASNSLPDLLRAATADLHTQAERHPFQAALMQGRLSRDAFGAQITQMWLLHRGFEPVLDAWRATDPAAARLISDHHFRQHLYHADALALGVDTAGALPVPALQAFLADLRTAAAERPWYLAGILYVLEGSTNGAKFIAKALEKAYGLSHSTGLSAQDPHGDEQRPRWQAFRAALADADLTETQRADVLAGANAAFNIVIDMMDELAELLERRAAG
jgi:heme oxygenase